MVRTARTLVILLLLTSPASADPVFWTEWKTAAAGTMTGVITLGDSSTVDVTYTGDHYFGTSTLAGEFDYWSAGPDSTYESSVVDNRPPANGLVAIGKNTESHTVTFSRPISDVIMPWMSVNGPGIQFENAFSVLSSGCGYWGCGTLTDAGGNLMRTAGGAEGHGVIQLPGAFTSLTFHSEGTEGWRGFTFGVLGPARPPIGVPEPSTFALFAQGTLAALGIAGWRRRQR
jgi:hypothetical protein